MVAVLRTLAACAAMAALASCSTLGDKSARGTAPARLALVIGNAAYQNAPPLKNPGNDAEDVCAALKAMNFRTLCHRDVRDRAQFEAHVREYVSLLGPQTIGVVHYSGHGVQARGANFLIPTQAQLLAVAEDPVRVLYGLQDLFERLRERPSRLQLVVLDACRTDLFAPAAAATRSGLLRSLEARAAASNGLLPITDAPVGTAVLYATASGDTAYDGRGRNGPLTATLLRHLRTSGIRLRELLDEVTRGVRAETARDYGRPMTPFVYGSFDGALCLGGCLAPPPPSVPN